MGSKYVNKPEVLIFSVYRSDVQDFHNQDCHDTIVNKLRQDSIPFKELDGRYQGVDEKSILVKADQLNLVQEICKQFRQDSYLHLSEDREATESELDELNEDSELVHSLVWERLY